MAKKGVKIWSCVNEHTDELIEKYAFRKGLTKSSAVADLVEFGLAQTGSAEMLERFIADNNSELIEGLNNNIGKRIDKLQRQVDRNSRDLAIIKKNDRYGDRAALGLLAWASWMTQYFPAFTNVEESTGKVSAKTMFKIGVARTHEIFWDAGGKLCRDPENVLNSFAQLGDFLDEDEMTQITGMSDDEWRYSLYNNPSRVISCLSKQADDTEYLFDEENHESEYERKARMAEEARVAEEIARQREYDRILSRDPKDIPF